MRTRVIKTIFKRELKDILRDKKTIFMTMIIPLILYPVLMLGMTVVMGNVNNTMKEKELNIAFSELPTSEILGKIEKIDDEGGKLNVVEVSDYQEAIEKEEISAYIDVVTEDGTPTYNIYINSSIQDNQVASSRIKDAILLYKEDLVDKNIADLGVDKEELLEPIKYEVIDIAEEEEVVGQLVGTILPFILITGILTGAMYPAIDTMAGEKERGTLETLLTLPISNLELVLGKYMAVAFMAIVNALLNLISIAFSMWMMFMIMVAGSEAMGQISIPNIDIAQMILPAIISVICIIIFAMIISALCMCVCAMAKSFKDAQNATTPLTMIVLMLSYTSMIPTIELDQTTANIPVVNVVLLIKSVLTFKYDITLITMVLLSNIVFMILSIWALSKIFNSEEVLFGSARGFSFLESRSNIQKGTMPSISDGTLMYCICFLAMMYISQYATLKFGMRGSAIHQVLFLVLPLALSIYVKSDLKKVYSMNMPKIMHIVGSIFILAGLMVINMIIGAIIASYSPSAYETLEQLNEMLKIPDSILLNLTIVALIPAICEEFLFRGFIFTSLRGKSDRDRNNSKRTRNAIIISGLMFGLMHMQLIRIIPTTILGIGIAYVVYKTGSIFVGVLMHFINNSLSVIDMHYPEQGISKILNDILVDSSNNMDNIALIMVVVVSIISVILGYILLRGRKNQEIEKIVQECKS